MLDFDGSCVPKDMVEKYTTALHSSTNMTINYICIHVLKLVYTPSIIIMMYSVHPSVLLYHVESIP